MLYKYIWLISRHYISQNTSSYSRYHTYEDEKEHAESGVEGIGCIYADYRKNSQSYGIHDQHDHVIPFSSKCRILSGYDKDQYGYSDGYSCIEGIPKGHRRRYSQYQIADDTSADGCSQTEYGYTQDIHAFFQSQYGPGDGKGDSACDFKRQQ